MRRPGRLARAGRLVRGRRPAAKVCARCPCASCTGCATPSTGREILVEAEPGKVYLDRDTGEPLEVVGKVAPARAVAVAAAVGGGEPALLQLVRPAGPEGPQRLPDVRPPDGRDRPLSSHVQPAPVHASRRARRRPGRRRLRRPDGRRRRGARRPRGAPGARGQQGRVRRPRRRHELLHPVASSSTSSAADSDSGDAAATATATPTASGQSGTSAERPGAAAPAARRARTQPDPAGHRHERPVAGQRPARSTTSARTTPAPAERRARSA